MLNDNQLSDLDSAARELNDRKMMLDTAVDVQVILRLMVAKNIATREEINAMREEVRNSPKYAKGYAYINQTAEEILKYRGNPQEILREMFRRKVGGNKGE